MAAPTGRLTAHPPASAPEPSPAPGVHPLPGGALLAVPGSAVATSPPSGGPPLPLVVALHGAGGNGRHMLDLLAPVAARRGVALLAPGSRGRTWDVVLGGYGPDVAAIDEALTAVFATVPVDPSRVAVVGFSDGASYALSIGVANGDLFRHVVAYSPGFLAPAVAVGRPRVYVSHGTRDAVLPIDRCSRRLVPVLRRDGYDVLYEEFDGGHVVPPDVIDTSLDRIIA